MNFVVIGAGFGDEGKGQTVSNLIKEYPETEWVIRFNGGQQAGHTVEYNNVRHVFSNFGSGTLQGVKTYWSKFCTINPSTIRKEYELLKSYGVVPKLYIDPMCPVTTPWDIENNRMIDGINKHGTVGAGFGTTIERTEKYFNLYAWDMKCFSIFENKLHNMVKHYFAYELPIKEIEAFILDVMWLVENADIHIQKPQIEGNVIFEGAQGILLDQDFGFFPNVTRSKTTTYNAQQIANDLGIKIHKVKYVSRYYHTRHGNGVFSNEVIKLKDNIKETNIYNEYQGIFRISPLNIDWLRYAIEMAFFENPLPFEIVFTCEDHLIDKDEVPVIIKDTLKYLSIKSIKEMIYSFLHVNNSR